MTFLVVGLGSMGKRRIRCLQKLGNADIVGIDPRFDRCQEVESLYGIRTFTDINFLGELSHFHGCLICTPPDKHLIYLKWVVEKKISSFVEASVLVNGLQEIDEQATKNNILICPSSTLLFHPAIKTISELISENYLGSLSNVIVRSGQFLPFWHKYERVEDFYVSNKETGGAREIVPFELTWMTSIFGFPTEVVGMHMKTIDIDGAPNIDDTYSLILKFDDHLGSLVVDVTSRDATRSVEIIGSKRHLKWFWENSFLKITQDDVSNPEFIELSVGASASGYNQNISEDMYIEEVRRFCDAIKGVEKFPNTLTNDIKVLDILLRAENR